MSTPTVWEKLDTDLKVLGEGRAKMMDDTAKSLGVVLADVDARFTNVLKDMDALRVQLMLTHDQLVQRENNVNTANKGLVERETKVTNRENGLTDVRNQLSAARTSKIRAEESEKTAWAKVEEFKLRCGEAIRKRDTLEKTLALLLAEKNVPAGQTGGDFQMPAPKAAVQPEPAMAEATK